MVTVYAIFLLCNCINYVLFVVVFSTLSGRSLEVIFIHQEMPKGDDSGVFYPDDSSLSGESLVLFGDGDEIIVSTGSDPVRFLLISGRLIGEAIAWRGPIVMNAEEELRIAFEEYGKRTFTKHQ